MIPKEHEQALKQLNQVFLEENTKINLSAFRTPQQSWIGNILDSLALLDLIKPSGNILDLGTGGGFPLLPLATCLPDLSLTGIDSTKKKIDAVKRIADKLNLNNVSLVSGRAEELGSDSNHREQYDLVLSRAVADTNTLLEYCAPFCKVGGKIILWKSLKIDKELEESLLSRAELTCHLTNQFEYELPEKFGKRQLLVFEKTSETSDKYPRKIGEAKKHPLV